MQIKPNPHLRHFKTETNGQIIDRAADLLLFGLYDGRHQWTFDDVMAAVEEDEHFQPLMNQLTRTNLSDTEGYAVIALRLKEIVEHHAIEIASLLVETKPILHVRQIDARHHLFPSIIAANELQ